MDHPWYTPLGRGLRAGAFFTAHLAVALVIIAGIHLIQSALAFLGNPLLFGLVPVKYIFDAVDVFVLLEFVVFGSMEAYVVFMEHYKGIVAVQGESNAA
jgi:hypothetical protein